MEAQRNNFKANRNRKRSDGRLWIGTSKTLVRYDYATNSFEHFHFPKGRSPRVNSIIESKDGKLLVGTSGYGLYQVVSGSNMLKELFDYRIDDQDNYFNHMYEDAKEMVATYAESKFATTEFYASLKNVAEKYEGKVLYEDNELEVAIAELDEAINNAKAMFTEGASKCNLTGYAVLLDRIRMGTATALTLGAEESEALIQQANEALSDDDAIADGLKARIKNLLYGQLKNSDNKLFEETLDEVTLETVKPKYDMTVFVKNPNIYKLKESRSDLSQENVPGWNIIGGELTTGWNQVGNDVIPADGMVSTWVATTTVWQTITDLPAGVYNVVMGFGERQSEEGVNEGSYMYVKTTEMADSLTSPIQYIGQSYPVDNHTMENIVVTDGKLTIGVQGGPSSHVFFNNVKLLMTAPAEGFDYNSAWSTAIDENVAPATTVERRYYDMTGRSVSASSRGVMIVKEVMNNGSVRTKKVIK